MIYNNSDIDIDIDISYYYYDDDGDDDDDDELLQSYKAAGLRYIVNRSTKTVINVDVASLVVAS
jgi:hypothetical protein